VDVDKPVSTGENAKPPIPQPSGIRGSILTMTPVVLTVMATTFAGLSSSEMTQAMYYRSVAAQHQSKAGDQWSFFQAKRTRGTTMETTAELFESLGQADPFIPADIDAVAGEIQQALEKLTGESQSVHEATDKVKSARDRLIPLFVSNGMRWEMDCLTKSDLPKIAAEVSPKSGASTRIEMAVDAINQRKSEAAVTALVAGIRDDEIDNAQRAAEDNAEGFDKACEPITNLIKQFRASLGELGNSLNPLRKPANEASRHPAVTHFNRINNSFKAAVLDFDARRYRQESHWNRKVAEILEVRVRRANIESDRHRERSKQFFYSMLVAQAGVTVASLALARQHRSLLWVFATIAGLVSLGFTAWVYLTF
jgi:hypothetical protein